MFIEWVIIIYIEFVVDNNWKECYSKFNKNFCAWTVFQSKIVLANKMKQERKGLP